MFSSYFKIRNEKRQQRAVTHDKDKESLEAANKNHENSGEETMRQSTAATIKNQKALSRREQGKFQS